MVHSGLKASIPTEQASSGPPQWRTGTPPEGALLLGHSDLPSRANKAPELYVWTGKAFQSLIGWYDGGVTHWMETGHRTDDRQDAGSDEATGNRRRLAEKAARRANRSAPAMGTERSGVNQA